MSREPGGPGSLKPGTDWSLLPGGNSGDIIPIDVEYFSELKKLSDKYGYKKVYEDFVSVYNKTTPQIDKGLLNLIDSISVKYAPDDLEAAIWFTVIYAGMIAEENKDRAILKKRIKRLGLYQVLIDDLEPHRAANFSKGKKWREIATICEQKGF